MNLMTLSLFWLLRYENRGFFLLQFSSNMKNVRDGKKAWAGPNSSLSYEGLDKGLGKKA